MNQLSKKKNGSLFNALVDCVPISMTQDEWAKQLRASMKHEEGWLENLLYTVDAYDLGWMVEQLALNCGVNKELRYHYEKMLRAVAPCPECRGSGYGEMKPDFIGDNPKTMKIGTVSICSLCHGSGVDPNYHPDEEEFSNKKIPYSLPDYPAPVQITEWPMKPVPPPLREVKEGQIPKRAKRA
jgi:hypothetical protein